MFCEVMLVLRDVTLRSLRGAAKEQEMSENHDLNAGRREALSNLRRLSNIILENLQEGSDGKLMDQKEMRLMGSTVLRSIRLFLSSVAEEQARLASAAREAAARQTAITRQGDKTQAGKD